MTRFLIAETKNGKCFVPIDKIEAIYKIGVDEDYIIKTKQCEIFITNTEEQIIKYMESMDLLCDKD